MSDHSLIAIILSNTSKEGALQILAQTLALVNEDYTFGFRGRGGVARMVFEGRNYKWQEEPLKQFPSASDIDAAAVRHIVEDCQWCAINGSIRIPGRDRLYDFSLILYPSFDPARPACVVFRLESSLYHEVYGEDDEFDQDAADTLRKLTVRLGANSHINGFQMLLVSSLADIKPFNVEALRQALVEPTPIQELMRGAGFPHGLVTGIKSSILPLAVIGQVWTSGNKFETVNGFSILDDLIPIDGDDSEEGQPEDVEEQA